MAIKRVPRRTRTFEFDGVIFGLRQPKLVETKKITELLSAYQRTLKKELSNDVKDAITEYSMPTGDMALMTEAQRYVVEQLCVDPDDHDRPIFGAGDEFENINEIPGEFLNVAWFCYSGQLRAPIPASVAAGILTDEDVFKYATIQQDAFEDFLKTKDADDAKDLRTRVFEAAKIEEEKKTAVPLTPTPSQETPVEPTSTSDET